MLKGKHILLGITGSIAAYKSAYLVRQWIKGGAEVRVIMTPLAKEFITPLTMATLSKHPILIDFFDPTNGNWNSHVDLGLWADVYVIAPATANTLAKMANGIADNLLLTSYLSAKCPAFVAPAMDLDMWLHPATQRNLQQLQSIGVRVIDPSTGELASGLEGKGRMAEPELITKTLHDFFVTQDTLKGKKVIITAGPTYEKLDPVRFIGNYSSGKMGFALAEECALRGAEVTLITGPVSLPTPHSSIHRINVESAAEMYEATIKLFPEQDIAILSAAVADFTPETRAEQKLKREGDGLTLHLQPTQDIAATLGAMKQGHQILVGFALETEHETQNALSKLQRKHLDFIVLNSLRHPQAGFGYDTNQISIIDKHGTIIEFPLKNKREVAQDIISTIEATH
ncbi:bifunctional phosphopantothenoylcysteine decarboxylase/phosphopantothenate--cysteine ligase CoaBC [Microbacter margulisiae]|uniref:Coenzyme A biosynthesis bifunctional protein CoaBC n=1 Tax=Microbacter margulisiae TaxID=1350067 RepID=A0A7W5DRM2_9PORP|nr:bifunctional phosphopantothenoylcysteine decarboxylase/phosphopantothenate--cysteine ligase CoaBC [Microbacter margulisiae]MBB3187811.1 phosphopantothenoylcysteine decarboxylase/phosphopantothenate--cysteine ligase [Microbacter margulisiae]